MDKQMINQILEQLFEQFMTFSIEKREELPKILVILIFLLFLVRRNNKKTKISNRRKKRIENAFNIIDEKINFRKEYTISEEIKKELYRKSYNKESILVLVTSIMEHLGLPDALPIIKVYNVSGCGDVEPGRCYIYGDQQSGITINLLPEYNLDTVASIVIHECMKHYLNVKKIRFKDESKNELLPDICAIYCGFGGIMYRGYAAITKQNKLHEIGYLTQSEIRYIMRKL